MNEAELARGARRRADRARAARRSPTGSTPSRGSSSSARRSSVSRPGARTAASTSPRAATRPASSASSTSARCSFRTGRATSSPTRSRTCSPTTAIALLFLIPGVDDTFRVNGRARIVDDPELLAAERGRRQVAAARHPRRDRGGVHAVPEGAHPLRPLEPREARRPLRAAELGRDPARVADPELDVDEYDEARAERYRRREGFY